VIINRGIQVVKGMVHVLPGRSKDTGRLDTGSKPSLEVIRGSLKDSVRVGYGSTSCWITEIGD
jgi:hypothetical protein